MKTKDSIIIFAACVALTAGEYSTNAQLLFDDFNDSVINTNLWQISLPFAGSQAFETNGRAVMIARGSFDTKQSFPPSIVVRGRFKFSGTEDFFQVALRSDLAIAPAFGERYGIHIKFSDNGQNVRILEYSTTNIVDIAPLQTFNFLVNTDYDFQITDDGNLVRVFLTNSPTPFIQGSSFYRAGNKISVYNREFTYSKSELDFLEIKANSVLTIETAAIRLRWFAESNVTYQVQYSTNFQSWSNLTSIVGTGSETNLIEWTDNQRKFYRLIKN